MKERQTTIKTPFSLTGKGLHTGLVICAEIKPSAPNTGISIVRVDVQPHVVIPVLSEFGGDCARGTVLAKDGQYVTTLEHLIAALHGLRVDNVVIELNGPEVPILDGSAKYWVEEILKAGIVEQDAEREYIEFSQPIELTVGNSRYRVEPADDFQVHCTIDFGNTVIGRQEASMTSLDLFADEIAPCRTFVFLHEVEPLLNANLIKGGDIENALVFVNQPLAADQKARLAAAFNKSEENIEVKNGLLNNIAQHFTNEPARHKLLDFVGDIMLLGKPVKGRFDILCPGHKTNMAFARHIKEHLNK